MCSPNRARKQPSRYSAPAISWARDASPRINPSAWQPLLQLRAAFPEDRKETDVAHALHEEHEFSDLFVAYVIKRHNRTQADLVDQLFNSSEKRLARALVILSRFGKEDKPETVTLPVSQETLAEMIGTTRLRVNFFMNRFRKLGFIDYYGGLEVNSSLLSVVLHE